jgi:predicted dehydrogenase
LAERALGAGKHVLVEKPLAVDVEQGERLVAAAAEARRVLACGHQERLVFEAMGLMALPERPTRIESVRAGPWTGRGDDVSVTMDLMSHDLDLALTLMGVQPRRVSARGKRVETSSADEITALLTFPDDARAELTASRIAAERARTMRLVYPSGEVAIDFIARSFDNTTPFALNAHFADTAEGRDPLGANVARFIDAVLGVAARPAVTGAEALEAMRLARTIDTAASLPSYARRRTPTNDPVH